MVTRKKAEPLKDFTDGEYKTVYAPVNWPFGMKRIVKSIAKPKNVSKPKST